MIYQFVQDSISPNGEPIRERIVVDEEPILRNWLDWLGEDRPVLCDNEPNVWGDSASLPTGCDVRGFVNEKRYIPALS